MRLAPFCIWGAFRALLSASGVRGFPAPFLAVRRCDLIRRPPLLLRENAGVWTLRDTYGAGRIGRGSGASERARPRKRRPPAPRIPPDLAIGGPGAFGRRCRAGRPRSHRFFDSGRNAWRFSLASGGDGVISHPTRADGRFGLRVMPDSRGYFYWVGSAGRWGRPYYS